MIIYFSNRDVRESSLPENPEEYFGDEFNGDGTLLRMYVAEPTDADEKEWHYKPVNTGAERRSMTSIRKRVERGDLSANWLVFLHGNNQSFDDNVRKCKRLHKTYGVNVIAFSWPSRPFVDGKVLLEAAQKLNFEAAVVSLIATHLSPFAGGFLYKKLAAYLRSRVNAENSTLAFNAFQGFVQNDFAAKFAPEFKLNLNFMSYSLGNYVLQRTVENREFTNGSGIYENAILCQADVDRDGHELWMSLLDYGNRIYVTHNEYDKVLALSDIYNKNRLGNTPTNLFMEPPVRYVDCTEGKNVGSTHALFFIGKRKNAHVHDLFKKLFQGKKVFPSNNPSAATGFKYNDLTLTYSLIDTEPYAEILDDEEED